MPRPAHRGSAAQTLTMPLCEFLEWDSNFFGVRIGRVLGHRLSPETALTLIENNFLKLATVVALNAKTYETLLVRAPKDNVSGGRTYDAVIGACAAQGNASTVLTFNAGDFTALGRDFEVVVPGTN